jgi:DNA-binding CsgD family transcriptional regulator
MPKCDSPSVVADYADLPQNAGDTASSIRRADMIRDDALQALAVLTPRQAEVLRWTARGLALPAIAGAMGIRRDSVSEYRQAIVDRLGVNLYAAVVLAVRAGWV